MVLRVRDFIIYAFDDLMFNAGIDVGGEPVFRRYQMQQVLDDLIPRHYTQLISRQLNFEALQGPSDQAYPSIQELIKEKDGRRGSLRVWMIPSGEDWVDINDQSQGTFPLNTSTIVDAVIARLRNGAENDYDVIVGTHASWIPALENATTQQIDDLLEAMQPIENTGLFMIPIKEETPQGSMSINGVTVSLPGLDNTRVGEDGVVEFEPEDIHNLPTNDNLVFKNVSNVEKFVELRFVSKDRANMTIAQPNFNIFPNQQRNVTIKFPKGPYDLLRGKISMTVRDTFGNVETIEFSVEKLHLKQSFRTVSSFSLNAVTDGWDIVDNRSSEPIVKIFTNQTDVTDGTARRLIKESYPNLDISVNAKSFQDQGEFAVAVDFVIENTTPNYQEAPVLYPIHKWLARNLGKKFDVDTCQNYTRHIEYEFIGSDSGGGQGIFEVWANYPTTFMIPGRIISATPEKQEPQTM